MADRASTASPGGIAAPYVELARRIKDLQRDVEQLKRGAGHPIPTFLWVPKADGSELWVQHVVSGNQQLIAGPL